MNLVGNIINGYMFLEVLGSGQYGVVYKVEKMVMFTLLSCLRACTIKRI